MDRPEATGVTTADTVDKSPEDFTKMSTLSMSPGMMDNIAVGNSITVLVADQNFKSSWYGYRTIHRTQDTLKAASSSEALVATPSPLERPAAPPTIVADEACFFGGG